jgi:hypothetical protein
MIDQTAHVTVVVKDALKLAAFGEPVGYAVSQTFGPVQFQDGSTNILPIWLITVTLPNPNIGQLDFSFQAIIPFHDGMPKDEVFRQSATATLEVLRQKKDAALRVVQPA